MPVTLIDYFSLIYRAPDPILPREAMQSSSPDVHTFLQPPAPSKRPNNKRASENSLSDDLGSDNCSDSTSTTVKDDLTVQKVLTHEVIVEYESVSDK